MKRGVASCNNHYLLKKAEYNPEGLLLFKTIHILVADQQAIHSIPYWQ